MPWRLPRILRQHRGNLWQMTQPGLANSRGPKLRPRRRTRENTWNLITTIGPKAVHIHLSALMWSRMYRIPIPTIRIYSQSPHVDYLGTDKTSRHHTRKIPCWNTDVVCVPLSISRQSRRDIVLTLFFDPSEGPSHFCSGNISYIIHLTGISMKLHWWICLNYEKCIVQ